MFIGYDYDGSLITQSVSPQNKNKKSVMPQISDRSTVVSHLKNNRQNTLSSSSHHTQNTSNK